MRLIFPPGAGRPIGPEDLLRPDRPLRADGPADAGTLAAVADLAACYAYPEPRPDGRPWVRANMITSADGAATADGVSGGLSGAADRLSFSVLRSLADVILVGAGTARAERYAPVRPAALWPSVRAPGAAPPPIAVLTRRLDLDLASPLIAGSPGLAPTIVLTTVAAPAARREAAERTAEVVVLGPEANSAAAAVTALARLGYARVLAEGGPTILAQLIAGSVLDELCLTISPVLEGGKAIRITRNADHPPVPPGRMTLAHLIENDGFLLCRYLRAT